VALDAALRFALGTGGDTAAASEARCVVVDPGPGGRRWQLDVYTPPRPRGTIVGVHGMSTLGTQDPRWVSAMRSLAAAGYRVVAPRFDDIAALQIHGGQPAQITSAVRAVRADLALCPTGKLGLFAVSFSGAITLHAAANETLRNHITAVCLVGTYGQMDRQLEWMFDQVADDPYALVLVLANYLPRVEPGLQDARAGLLRAAEALRRDGRACPLAHLGPLPDATRGRITSLLRERRERMGLLAAIQTGCADDIAAIDPRPVLRPLRAPVTLLHGRDDPVIAPEQSALLGHAIVLAGGDADVAITPLISHGDRTHDALTLLRHAPPVLAALTRYFWRCTTTSQPRAGGRRRAPPSTRGRRVYSAVT
jgi:pimeloyl-ACP methyl ester carboxylesterase